MKIDDVRADLHNLADEFMADGHGDRNGLAGPLVPIVDMNIGSANSGAVDADQNVVNANGRLGDVLDPTVRSRLLPSLKLSLNLQRTIMQNRCRARAHEFHEFSQQFHAYESFWPMMNP